MISQLRKLQIEGYDNMLHQNTHEYLVAGSKIYCANSLLPPPPQPLSPVIIIIPSLSWCGVFFHMYH
jgi:hypothetical protein